MASGHWIDQFYSCARYISTAQAGYRSEANLRACSITNIGQSVLDAVAESSLRAAEARLDAIGLLPNLTRVTYDDRWTGETGREYALPSVLQTLG